jgi:hypothetical protein
MSHFYSTPARAADPHALPDCEVFQLTATEVAAMDEDAVYEFGKRHAFRLHSMNSRTQAAMLDAIVEENDISGGWFYWYCFPGCMPEGTPIGPYKTHHEAIAAAQAEAAE